VPDQHLRFRPVLDQFAAYLPCPRPAGAGGEVFDLASNESPFGPLPSVTQAIATASAGINHYPDAAARVLTKAIADRHGVPASHVTVGCGSTGLTQALLTAAAGHGDQVVCPWRSFEAYPILIGLAGAGEVRVPLHGERHDLAAMARAVTPATRVVLVCSPNNPTGTVVGRNELATFLRQVPADCLVVLDEAYAEYVRDPQAANGLGEYRDHPNLAVLRTFSKAYGLAGARAGYLVAHEPVIRAVRAATPAFSVSALAQAAAAASLAAEPELAQRVEWVAGERTRVRDELLAQGWTVPDSGANFVWLRLGDSTLSFAGACEQAGVRIRAYDGEGARVSIGGKEANDTFLAAAKAFLASQH
jgi:histidinol-phosphate aminotransferase